MTDNRQQWNILGYNVLDLVLIFSGLIAGIIPAIIFKSDWITIINAILGIFCVFTQSKGKVATQFIGIVYFGFYITSSVFQAYWGEVIIYGLIMIPLYIYGITEWLKNRDKKDNTVIIRPKTSVREYLILGITCIALFIGIYFLLKALNTSEILVSTLAFVALVAAVYLLSRRNKYNLWIFIFVDTFAFILWLIPVVQGQLEILPITLTVGFQAIYDVYGIFEWAKLEKKQKAEKIDNQIKT